MNKIKALLATGLAIAPAAVWGQLTLSGPGGVLTLDTNFGSLQPEFLGAGAALPNLLFQSEIFIQTDPAPFAGFNPVAIYLDGFVADTSGSGPSLISLGYTLDNLDVLVTFRPSTAPDGVLPGTLLSDYFIMDISITNVTESDLFVSVGNFWDFDLTGGGDDILVEAMFGPATTFAQSNPASPYIVFASGEALFTVAEDFPDLLFDDLISPGPFSVFPIPASGNAAPHGLAFINDALLGENESATFTYDIGILSPVVIPEPSMIGLLGFLLVGSALFVRRRR